MASVFDFAEIDLRGMNVDSFRWGAEKIRKSLGGGRVVSALVGHAGGLHRWSLSAGVLPADTDYGNLIGDADDETRFDYYFEFFKTHTTGEQEVFMLEWLGKKYHAAFVDTGVDYEVFTSDLFAGGVEIEQRTVEGHIYNADGSLFWPAYDIEGLVGWYPVLDRNDNAPWADQSGEGNDLTASAPRANITTNGGINVLRWNGTDDTAFVGPSFPYSTAFMVACATDASFAATRGLISGFAASLLTSETSGTKFVDQGYGAAFQYRKNGTDFADNNAQCSMSGVLAVLDVEFTSASAYGVVVGNEHASSGIKCWTGDVAYLMLVDNTALTTAQKTQIRQFLSNECGGTITVI